MAENFYAGCGMRDACDWSAEHRLGSLERVFKRAETVLGAPVHGAGVRCFILENPYHFPS